MASLRACSTFVVFLAVLMGLGLCSWRLPHSPVKLRGIWWAYNSVKSLWSVLPPDMTEIVTLHEEVMIAEKVAFAETEASETAKRQLFFIQLDGLSADGNRFTPLGLKITMQDIKQRLNRRLRLARHLARLPALSPPTSPTVLLGLPRTGSTMLHRLLAVDPSTRTPLWWEVLYDGDDLSPCVDCFTDPRGQTFQQEKSAQIKMLSSNFLDELGRFHILNATAIEEVTYFIDRYSWLFDESLLAPSAVAKVRTWYSDPTVDRKFVMVHLRAWLALQQSVASSPTDVRWVLKAPILSQYLPELVDIFPDAKLVFTSRDPKKILPSAAGLTLVKQSVRCDYGRWGLEFIGDYCTGRYLAWAEAQSKLVETYPQKALLLRYDEMIANPLAAVRQIYAHIGHALSEDVVHAMKRHLAENTQHSKGKPDYSLAMFGLRRETIDAQFEEYRKFHEAPA